MLVLVPSLLVFSERFFAQSSSKKSLVMAWYINSQLDFNIGRKFEKDVIHSEAEVFMNPTNFAVVFSFLLPSDATYFS